MIFQLVSLDLKGKTDELTNKDKEVSENIVTQRKEKKEKFNENKDLFECVGVGVNLRNGLIT